MLKLISRCSKGAEPDGNGHADRRVGLCVNESTPYATPEAGYSSLRENPASGATGSAKVSATASHSSGDFTPRAHMWSLASSLSRVLLS